MKFCLKQKIVTNLPSTEKIEKVSGVTEYEALRAEKLFRYEYSNQLNTSLLTFAFTVFTAGLIIFTLLFQFGGLSIPNSNIDENSNYNITVKDATDEEESNYQIEIKDNSNKDDYTYVIFVEYFFACFFLLPCFFSRINFRYTVKNSLRIGQLTDYTREKIKFDDNESWESFKRNFNTNYFYQKRYGVGGAKDIPYWINIISCLLSTSVGMVGIYSMTTKSNVFSMPWWGWHIFFAVIISSIIFKRIEPLLQMNKIFKITYIIVVVEFVLLIILAVVLYRAFDMSNAYITQLIYMSFWGLVLQICILITPQYDKEIELANCVLDYTRAKLREAKNKPSNESEKERNIRIFNEFLDNSVVVNNYKEKSIEKNKYFKKIIFRKCKTILYQLDMYNNDLTREEKNKCINNYLNAFLKDEVSS